MATGVARFHQVNAVQRRLETKANSRPDTDPGWDNIFAGQSWVPVVVELGDDVAHNHYRDRTIHSGKECQLEG